MFLVFIFPLLCLIQDPVSLPVYSLGAGDCWWHIGSTPQVDALVASHPVNLALVWAPRSACLADQAKLTRTRDL